MEKYERRLDILKQRKLIWRREPTTDIPTETHSWGWYYKEGTFQNYALFQHKGKIGTIQAFRWHLRVLQHLNPDLCSAEFESVCRLMGDARYGFVTFSFKEENIKALIESLSTEDLEIPPPNNIRKIVFREFHGLTTKQTQQIAGRYAKLGKGILAEDIYEEMLKINDQKIKITINGLAANLKCTKRTIHRNMNDVLRTEKNELNNTLIT